MQRLKKFHGKNKWDEIQRPKVVFEWRHISGITATVVENTANEHFLTIRNPKGIVYKEINILDKQCKPVSNPDFTDIIYNEIQSLLKLNKY